jgi:hypothetical protein
MEKNAEINHYKAPRARPIPIALVNLGGLLPFNITKLANDLNRLKNQKLFVFHPIALSVDLPDRDLPHGYSLHSLYQTVSNALAGSGYSFGIGITHEILEDTRFNWHDTEKGVGCITIDQAEVYNPAGRTIYQYVAYLVLCEALCITGRTQFEHRERFYCLFDECLERMDLKACLMRPHIHCKDRLKAVGFTDRDIDSAEAILHYVKKRHFSNVLAVAFSKWYTGVILGILISSSINLFIKFPVTWNMGIVVLLWLIILIILLLQYFR